jgi:hypothetical protein
MGKKKYTKQQRLEIEKEKQPTMWAICADKVRTRKEVYVEA